MSCYFFALEMTLRKTCWVVLQSQVGSENRTYLLQGMEQCDAPGIGATDEALGVLQTKTHHGWVDHRGWDADGMVVSYTF